MINFGRNPIHENKQALLISKHLWYVIDSITSFARSNKFCLLNLATKAMLVIFSFPLFFSYCLSNALRSVYPLTEN